MTGPHVWPPYPPRVDLSPSNRINLLAAAPPGELPAFGRGQLPQFHPSRVALLDCPHLPPEVHDALGRRLRHSILRPLQHSLRSLLERYEPEHRATLAAPDSN